MTIGVAMMFGRRCSSQGIWVRVTALEALALACAW
jgi:hypothetical protein